MLYEMNLKEKPFNAIRNGTKIIEMRLYDEKRQKLKVGDYIKFLSNSTDNPLFVEIVGLHLYPNFNYIYNRFNKIELGYFEDEVAKPEDMLDYYPLIEQTKYGVVGIEIKLIK